MSLDQTGSANVLDSIRREAIEGLLTLPRVGMGVGGFLAGIRSDGRTRILSHVPIACAHARGPGFLLTDEELGKARELKASAAPLEVLGLYISKPRGGLGLNDGDTALLDALCPESDQIALIIGPSTLEPARVALFEKNHAGFEKVSEWALTEIALADAEPEAADAPNTAVQAAKMAAAAAESAGGPDFQPAQTDVKPREAQPRPEPPLQPAPALPRSVPPRPVHQSPARFREPELRERRSHRLAWTAGALVLIAAAVAVMLRARWLSPPELSLDVAEENGTIVFRWNRNAVAGADRGRLLVSDSGQLSQFPLGAERLAAGFFRYSRKSDHIVVKLVVGQREARAVFFGNSTPRGTGQRGKTNKGS